MAGKLSRDALRQKKVSTRDTLGAAREYCDRHGYCMPLEYFIAIGNGKDPRTGTDIAIDLDDLAGGISVSESTRAMAEAAKYIYIPASKVEIAGDADIRIAPVQIDEGVAASLAQKLQDLGIGIPKADEFLVE